MTHQRDPSAPGSCPPTLCFLRHAAKLHEAATGLFERGRMAQDPILVEAAEQLMARAFAIYREWPRCAACTAPDLAGKA